MLTDTEIRRAKPKEKAYKLSDEKGLYLEIMPNGARYWRMKYRFEGKEKRAAFGVYPEVTLKEARDKRDEARKLLAQGIDPTEHKRAIKAAKAALTEHSFEVIAREWHQKVSSAWTPGHSENVLSRLEQNIFPAIGDKPISTITAPDLLKTLRETESRAPETARRLRQTCGQIFRYAIATGRAERDLSGDLRGALTPAGAKRHHASITKPAEIGDLLRNIDGYHGSVVVRAALRLAPLVFVRPGELRQAEWSEINFEAAEWRIPGPKMKMRSVHVVPLSQQALTVLQNLQPLTGHGRYVFPSDRSPKGDRCLSENAVLAALRRMGYEKGEMTGHGFRSMASTLLNEQGWHRDAVERQLAHAERNAVRAAYNYAEHLPERRKMMQAWADYLDRLKQGADVIELDARRKA
ncbi:tyrosine-type recombinase/integrase [Methylococcus mesophilus]|uniref:tyrosine-type recombinase/integrase n=1 Tax=Methylococcus mesophilus TaxID=2993564 RepID=UPI00224AD37A|nr:integrase arm-type DNA-binding domain-containing protein [Methylococcus mesophilus]UZR27878.1 integrase arm-type DNA-binding domain-containing protein [Methylococcus mesophilus]